MLESVMQEGNWGTRVSFRFSNHGKKVYDCLESSFDKIMNYAFLIGGQMNPKLFVQTITKLLIGFVLIGVVLFVPAGTLTYWNAWLFLGLLFIPMLIVGTILMVKNPVLLRNRLKAKEVQGEQKQVVVMSGLLFLISFIVSGLNYRFEWMILPQWVILVSSILFFLGYLLYAEVLRENTYLSRIIEVQENQKVIDTGLYGIVRHPMYLATMILFLSMPLVLGSLFSFLVFLFYPFLIAKRIKNEEKLLEKELKGYSEYMVKVKYRIIPFVW